MDLIEILKKAKSASYNLLSVDDAVINKCLQLLADKLVIKTSDILEANKKDLALLDKENPIYDRVLLNEEHIKNIAKSVREIAGYLSPIGEEIESRILQNGLKLKKVRVPIGVVGAIFEARPNVVIDIFALCFKSKNVCILKGGSDSAFSNEILINIIKECLKETLNNDDFAFLLPNNKEIIAEFLKADDYVDLIIPRGSQGLIKFVRENSIIPVIETGAGVCHTYFDEFGDTEKAKKIVFNAKTTRPSVCNALDTLIIHVSHLKDLPIIAKELLTKNVEIHADEQSFEILKNVYPENLIKKATDEDLGCEYLSLKMSIKTVENLDEAIFHINTFGSKHSEAIVTENKENAEKFLKLIDAACVYVNASTRFTDGGQFGLGAELGISTQKLHARGPMGIKELTSYKWEIIGDGQIRV